MITASCRAPTNTERVRDYEERVRHRPDFQHLIHASRVAKGVRRQGELVRMPIPKHRALIVLEDR